MAIDPHYIPAFSIEDVILDKDTGYPLSGGMVWFYEDNQRTVLKPVYQISGNSPDYNYTLLPNPMTLSSIGTFQDSLGNPVIPYFYPYTTVGEDEELIPDYYFVEVFSSTGVFQFSREAVPYIPDIGTDEFESLLTNAISNPQFSRVFWDTSISNSATYTFTSVTNQVFGIAPDWDLIVTCPSTGTVTVAQVTPIGSSNVITNPGTLLNIKASGVSNLQLRQRLYGSPNLWGTQILDMDQVPGFLSASFIAKTYTGTALQLGMYYSQSGGTVTDQQIVNANLTSDGNYNPFYGSIQLPISDNPGSSPTAYVDIYFDIPTTTMGIDISSVAVVGTGAAPIDNLLYDQVPVAREIDQLYNFYDPLLRFKQIPSLLTGWDFQLNPRQFPQQQSNTTTPGYLMDQTIIQSAVANLTIGAATGSNALTVTTTANSEAFYILQYLDGDDALKTLSNIMSSNFYGFASASNVTVQVTMYYSTANGTIPALAPMSPGTPATIVTIAYNAGKPTVTLASPTTWSQIMQVGGYTNIAAVPIANGDIGFMGYNGLANYGTTSTTSFYAIVVAFAVPTSGTKITINSVSCVPGYIATRPAPLNFIQTLQQCQHYYEKSYDNGTAPGTASTIVGTNFAPMPVTLGTTSFAAAGWFEVSFNTAKRITPSMTLYSPSAGTANKADFWIESTVNFGNSPQPAYVVSVESPMVTGYWQLNSTGRKSVGYQPQVLTNTSASVAQGTGGVAAALSYQFVADSRLGLV